MSENQNISKVELHLSDELLIKLKKTTERTGSSEAEPILLKICFMPCVLTAYLAI